MKILFKLFAAGAAVEACEDGIHAHETNCNMYYQCSHGNRHPDQLCPDGLLFNPDVSVCDWPENVDCGEDCADGIHAHEENCNMYYQCSHGHQWPDQECPEGLLFNPDVMVCDWPDNVDCGSDPSKWECYKDCVGNKWWIPSVAKKCSKQCFGWNKRVAKEAKESCEDGIHAHETKCNTFYQCANGHRYPDQDCPDGLMYNSEKEYCDWPDNVTCPEPPKERCNRGDLRPHETDCKKYYECHWRGNESEESCGWGEIFNAKKLECDAKWKPWVKCDL